MQFVRREPLGWHLRCALKRTPGPVDALPLVPCRTEPDKPVGNSSVFFRSGSPAPSRSQEHPVKTWGTRSPGCAGQILVPRLEVGGGSGGFPRGKTRGSPNGPPCRSQSSPARCHSACLCRPVLGGARERDREAGAADRFGPEDGVFDARGVHRCGCRRIHCVPKEKYGQIPGGVKRDRGTTGSVSTVKGG